MDAKSGTSSTTRSARRQNPAVVGRHDHHPVAGGEFADEPQYLLDLDEVQVRGRLVGQDQRRIERDRARNRHSLLLTAAEITRPVRYPLLQADARKQLSGALVGRATWLARREQWHHDILQCGEARHEIECLKHDPDGLAAVIRHLVAFKRCHIDVTEFDGS